LILIYIYNVQIIIKYNKDGEEKQVEYSVIEKVGDGSFGMVYNKNNQ
jgi:hypothetical protein